MSDMEAIARLQNSGLCASITCMIRHYVARRAKVIFDHPHNAESGALLGPHGCESTKSFDGVARRCECQQHHLKCRSASHNSAGVTTVHRR